MSIFNLPKGTVLVFYKGTCVPSNIEVLNIMKNQKPIELALKHGVSPQQQIKDYLEDLDKIEQKLVNYSKGQSIDITKAFEDLYSNPYQVMSQWCLNVYCLIKLKALQDDNMNGFVCIGEQFYI